MHDWMDDQIFLYIFIYLIYASKSQVSSFRASTMRNVNEHCNGNFVVDPAGGSNSQVNRH